MEEMLLRIEAIMRRISGKKNKNGSEINDGAVYISEEYISMRGIENVRKDLAEDLRKINSKLPLFKQIQKIYIKEDEFEKNTSKKIMRAKFLEEGNKIGI